MSTRRLCRLPVVLLASAGAVANGQQLAFSTSGGSASESAGHVVVRIHDVDHDGRDDLAIGAPGYDVGIATNTGRVLVASGLTGAVLLTAQGSSALERFGAAIVPIADVSFDGVPELAVGAPGFGGAFSNGAIRILDGVTLQSIGLIVGPATSARIGERLTRLDDQTGDGRGEIATGARGLSIGPLANAGAAIIYDPATGSIVRQFDGLSAFEGFGTDVASIQDFSGDSRRELVVGAPGADPFGSNGAGSIHVYDPVSGALLRTFFGVAANDGLGTTCTGVADLDGDAVPDVLGGAPSATVNGITLAGSAFVFSMLTGQTLGRFDGTSPNDQLGRTLAALDDLDGDGVPDFAIGSNTWSNGPIPAVGRVLLIRALSQTVLYGFDGPGANAEFANFIGPLGDLNADGRNDFAIGWEGFSGTFADQGSAEVHYGQSPSLAIFGTGQMGTPYELRFHGHAGAPVYLLLAGAPGNLQTPLGLLCLAIVPFPIVIPIGVFDANGLFNVTGTVPNTGMTGSATAYLQAAFMTPLAPAQGWLGQCTTLTIFP